MLPSRVQERLGCKVLTPHPSSSTVEGELNCNLASRVEERLGCNVLTPRPSSTAQGGSITSQPLELKIGCMPHQMAKKFLRGGHLKFLPMCARFLCSSCSLYGPMS